ncbi:rod shape-determining protein MreD [Syntrophomonas palmitatica]|uniref:rod shape-determining protein MreD n=1 Tax=Syntrophomonas palmitatica TaxID=402877 RepID=UPI0006D1FD91|nr:rod shape-determining protein MreD [Syntrophomonas palmitatica]
MRYVVLALLPWLAIFLQSTVFSIYSINGTVPDLVLIFVSFFALINGAIRGTVYGFLCGMLEDLFTGRFIGVNALSKALTAYILGRIQTVVFKDNLLVGILTVLIATVINTFFLLLLSLMVFDVFHLDAGLITSLLYQSAYNMLLTVPLYIWYYGSSQHGLLRFNREN